MFSIEQVLNDSGAKQARDIRRFLKKIKVLDSGCWLFTGHIDKTTGYGRFWFDGRVNGAHLFAYKTFVGSLEADKEHHHRCENRWCVNPLHLVQLTWAEHRKVDGAPWRSASDARKAAITHCPKGHAYSEHGRWRKTHKGGKQRRCTQCDRDYATQRRTDLKVGNV